MNRRVFALLSVSVADTVHAQDRTSPEDLLPRFRGAIKESLRRIPDYTCFETITRSRRSGDGGGFQPFDTIRLQVGLIGGRERHAWPDATRFDDREARDLVNRGIIGTGNFATHVQHVFLSPATTFTAPEAVHLGGVRAVRIGYEVPVEYSSYKLRAPPEEAEVGVRGAFWIDPDNLDLLRLEVHADEIPPELGMSKVSESINYGRVQIGGPDVLLATSSELIMVSLNGEQYRNQIAFSDCRQFRTDSKIRFDGEEDAPPSTAETRPAVRQALPPSVLVDLTLDSDIDPAKSAIGDSVRAVVTRPIRDATQAIAREGSIVQGRIIRLERSAQPFDHYIVGLEFHTLETAGASIDFLATMHSAGPAPGLIQQSKQFAPVFTRKRNARMDILVREKPRGEGVLHWDAKRPQIRRGLKMRWLTFDGENSGTRLP